MGARLTDLAGDLIFDQIPHAIFTVDVDRRITSFNPAAERITGWSAEDAVGRFCHDLLQTDHCGGDCFLARSLRGRESVRDQRVVIRHRSGAKVPVSVTTAPLVNAAGRLLGGVEMFRDLSEVEALRCEARGASVAPQMVARTPSMERLKSLLAVVAKSDCTVLVQGEAGTGKELVARTVHSGGPRRDGPFVAVNCGAIPDTLAESVLFGHVRGAFTNATRDQPGRFALADGGTLLLDEVGELSPAAQVKLLRVLQEHEFTPLGAAHPVPCDVRVVAATNRNLQDDVQAGRFRLDLYYRLDIVRIEIPPLRDRRDDIAILAQHFVDQFAARQRKPIREIDRHALGCMLHYAFPGNVRELENMIEHAFVVCPGDVIRAEDLPLHFQESVCCRTRVEARCECGATNAISPLQASEASAIRDALDRHAANRARTAKALGISRNTLWRKMQRYGIE